MSRAGMDQTKESIIQKFSAQRISAYIHQFHGGYDQRQCSCLRARKDLSLTIDLKKNPGAAHAHYSSLQTCGSIHSCPVCASKITEHRKNEIQEIIDKTADKHHYLVTLTFPHYETETCGESRRKFMDARRRMKNWSEVQHHTEFVPFRKILQHHQYDGSVTTVEVTYGVNGWHIHSHELFIFDKPVDDLRKFRADIFANWTKACLYSGIEIKKPLAFHRRAVQVDALHGDHIAKMTSYLTKISTGNTWGMAAELTKGSCKKQQNGNITPFGMLFEILDNKNNMKKYGQKFWEYCQTFKGKQAIRFSKGLKKKYGIEEKTDEEIVTESDLLASLYGFFEIGEWKNILKLKMRGFVLQNSDVEWNQLVEIINSEIRKRACNDQKTGKALLAET
jgi:hypothetical protein